MAEEDKRTASELAIAKSAGELQKVAAEKAAEIKQLRSKLDASEVAQELAINKAVGAASKERDKPKSELERAALKISC